MNRMIFALALVALVLALFAPGTAFAGDMGGGNKTVSCVERDPEPSVSQGMIRHGPKKKLKKKRRHRGHHGCVQARGGM